MSSLAHDSQLPSEILLIIFSYVDINDLYQLTDVSARFCRLSLIVYFDKRKIVINPHGRMDLQNPIKTRDMLSILRKTRLITSFNRLSCALLQPHKSLLKDISDLTAILKNAERVEEFEVEILPSGEDWTPEMVKQVNAGNALSIALNELLTAATHVSHSVAVRHGTSLKNVLQKAGKSNGPCRWFLDSMVRLFSFDKSKAAPSISGAARSTSLTPRFTPGRLRALEVNSIILLTPSFLGWSIQTINSNEITSLSFDPIDFRDVRLSTLLPSIDAPALKVLSLRGHTPLGALVDFMSRHPGIAVLTVNSIDTGDWNSGSAASNNATSLGTSSGDLATKLEKAFANVAKLACCPQGLSYLLSDALHPHNPTVDLFPSLRFISVLWSLGMGQKLKMSLVSEILAPIANRMVSTSRVEFMVTYRADTDSSWRPRSRPTFPQKQAGFLSRHVPSTKTSRVSIGQTSSNPNPVTNESPLSLFSIFTEIKLELTAKADIEGIPTLINALAGTFTNIKHVRVDTRTRGERPVQENKQMKLTICYQILKHFRHLKVVHVDGSRCKVVERDGRGV